jgi:subtilisin family serine protease
VLRCIAPRAEVVVKGYLNRAGAEFGFDLVPKMEEALAENPDLISVSAGAKSGDFDRLLALDVFLEHLSQLKGVIVVAAAGNDGDREFFFPAASPQTVSVGALAEDRRHRASFSNYGGWVDVYAPGEDIVNAYLTGDYTCTEYPNEGEKRTFAGMARWSGTSFATPLVAGLIAGRMSATGENARQAADALLAYAQEHSIPGVGRVLLPGDACASIEHRGCEPCRSGCGHRC